MFNFRTLGDIIRATYKKPGANPQQQQEPTAVEPKAPAKKRAPRKAK
jgi:hypothetical protein